jgi:hypothetical protein
MKDPASVGRTAADSKVERPAGKRLVEQAQGSASELTHYQAQQSLARYTQNAMVPGLAISY